MRKEYRALRIELPDKLYEKFKDFSKKEYKTPTSVIRELVIKYIEYKEKNG